MGYYTNFPKFGAQSKGYIMKPIYYHPALKSKGFMSRALKSLGPSGLSFGICAGLYLVFVSEWKVICENIPIYNKKFVEEK